MGRTHPFPARFIRWTSLSVSLALLLTSLAMFPVPLVKSRGSTQNQGNQGPENSKARKVKPEPPRPGAPEVSLPNLTKAGQRQAEAPEARRPIPSTVRSKRKPLESRHGRKVGDPLPPKRRASTNETGNGSERVSIASADAHDRVGTVRSHHARRSGSANFFVTPVPQGGSAQNVVWTNAIGVSVSGNNLTKTAYTAWGNAGAASTQTINSGDGYVEFTATENNTHRICGLSHGDSNQDWTDIDFGAYPRADGYVSIVESGTYHGEIATPYSAGDVLRVAVEGGVVKYRKNGTLFYASTIGPTYPLLVDTSLYSNGSTITNVVIGGTSGGSSSSDQYTQNLYQWALLRQPSGDESSYWTDIMRSAYPQGQTSMLMAMREFGKTVFESAEYAARNRSDHDYIYDLYKTYLMREPDQQGWDYWTASVPLYGREHVRRGFDESTEFINLVATLGVSGAPSSNVSSLMTARVDSFNQPGSGLPARDAEWSVPLVSLPGRAGLDLGLSLSYSSMVWTRFRAFSQSLPLLR